jgi:hypothetical protein
MFSCISILAASIPYSKHLLWPLFRCDQGQPAYPLSFALGRGNKNSACNYRAAGRPGKGLREFGTEVFFPPGRGRTSSELCRCTIPLRSNRNGVSTGAYRGRKESEILYRHNGLTPYWLRSLGGGYLNESR